MASESKSGGGSASAAPFPYRHTWGLRKLAREAVLAALQTAQGRLAADGGAGAGAGGDAPAAMVLVVDDFATQLLNSLFSAAELSAAGFIGALLWVWVWVCAVWVWCVCPLPPPPPTHTQTWHGMWRSV